MPRKLDPALVAQIRSHLASPEGQAETLGEIAKRFGVSVWVIHRHRNALGPPTTGREMVDQALADAERDPRTFINRIMSNQATMLTADQQRAVLSELILHTPNPAIKVSAQNALTRLDSQSGASMVLGPGVPLTEDGRVDRLSLLLVACGLPTIRRALAKAFPNAKALQKSLDEISQPSDPLEDEAERLAPRG